MAAYIGFPIWRDFESDFGAVHQVNFSVNVGDDVIYTGLAYRQPGQENLKVRINDICADYILRMASSLDDSVETSSLRFTIMNQDTSPSTVVDSVTFVWDWSYIDGRNFDSHRVLSAPVSAVIPPNGSPHVISIYTYMMPEFKLPVKIGYRDGTSRSVSLEPLTKAEAMDAYEFAFRLPVGPPYVKNYDLNVDEYNDVEYIEIFPNTPQYTQRYVRGNSCPEYALYYLNAFGGWDCLVLNGRTSLQMDITRNSFTREYDNRTRSERGTVNFMNEVSGTFTLRTGWMTEEGAANIWHLVGSTDVMLRSMSTGEWTPLVLDATSVKMKTYAGEGRKLISYELQATSARKGVRR
ncbi:MAG: hypothetical protein NC115_12130 [Bacteroidales bacterium]|nr:hypothetical protein [Bacteroidales bacterium]